MRWRQFLTPVISLSPEQARNLVAESGTNLTILDVRQPAEYAEGHIPGAMLMPLADLADGMKQLSAENPLLVYCAIGGRSRIAAQLLAGNGFSKVMNLSGGFKAWNGATGFGSYDSGLELFPQTLGLEQAIVTAWGLENALEAFYATQMGQAVQGDVADVFGTLAKMESSHKRRLQRQYADIVDAPIDGTGVEAAMARNLVEGGLTTEEYLARAKVDTNDVMEVLQFAMMLEAQAMDLYARAARRADDVETRAFLDAMTREEKSHLAQLATLLDRHLEGESHA